MPVQYPDVSKLPWHWDNGVKVFRLVAEPVKRELIPGTVLDLWGYSGSAPGPMIEVNEGDRVRITVQLIEAATDAHLWAENYERDIGGGLAVDLRVRRVLELLRHDRVRDLAQELLGLGQRALHAQGSGRENEFRTEIGQHLAPNGRGEGFEDALHRR